jgi:hypothetical protein
MRLRFFIQYTRSRLTKGKLKMKKVVLISFATEAETDLEAVFALNKIFYQLPENDLVKFDVFDVVEADGVKA